MKYIRTANLVILKTWLVGGQIDSLGNRSEGFNTFTDEEYSDTLNSVTDVKRVIEDLIVEYGDSPSVFPLGTYKYYHDYYKFKMPSYKNLNLLAEDIWEWVQDKREKASA